MKAETLHKIEEALRRLDESTFGYCFECGEEISERRLRALPFAVRCKDCEEAREMAQQRERVLAQRRGSGLAVHGHVRAKRSRASTSPALAPAGGSGTAAFVLHLAGVEAARDCSATLASRTVHAEPAHPWLTPAVQEDRS